jgi:hypothetical protein
MSAKEASMLFDTIFAIALALGSAIVVALLAFSLSRSVAGRLRAAGALAAWFIVVVAAGASGALGPEYAGALGLGAMVVIPVIALCVAFFAFSATAEALSAMPLPALVAVNALRLLGVSFVMLYSAQRLPAPFAPLAGWGDIFVGATALPVAFMVWRDQMRASGVALVWNAIGALDLIDAIALGATSAPGPIQIFTGPPSSQIMTTLPWILIPAFLVPIFLSLHLAIFSRLRRSAGARLSNASVAPTPLGAAASR